MKKYHHAGMLLTTLLLSCAVSAQGLTAEQMQQLQARIQAEMLKAYGLPAAPAGSSMAGPAAPPVVSEEELAEKLRIGGAGSVPFFDVVTRRDGFLVNGQAILDPEGRISRYAVDPIGGSATYLAETAGRAAKIKWISLGRLDQPVDIGQAVSGPNGWTVTTASGKVLSGELLILIPGGVIVSRQSAAFRYDAGKGVSNIAFPDGYQITPLQHGAVGTTDTILLERQNSSAGNPVADIGKLFGRIAGARIEDYAFMNLRTGSLIPLNIDSGGKSVHSFSDCRRKNGLVNYCERMTSFESLYDLQGQRNLSHYYWRADWFRTPSGAYAVVQENGLKEINIIDLSNGRRINAFSRGLGIAGYNVVVSGGKVRIVANWAFQDHVIPDVEAFVQTGGSSASAEASAVASSPVAN